MKKKFLEIGSVVLLKKVKKKVMIIGFMPQDRESKEIKDYVGVMYPEGYVNPSLFFPFNIDDIETVCFEGYKTEESEEFMHKIEKLDL